MARKLQNVENETQKLQELKYNEKHFKKVENKNCTLQDLEYDKKIENRGK